MPSSSFLNSSMLTSQGLVLATAMAVSAGTVILFDLFRQSPLPPAAPIHQQPRATDQNKALKSCLSSGSKKESKKRVKFADDVKYPEGNGEAYRKRHEIQKKSCGNEILGLQKMPANRASLYGWILKDRVQRMECSY